MHPTQKGLNLCQPEDLAKILRILGNPLNLAILTSLLEEPKCVCDLVGIMHCRQPCISQHLMQLRHEGLVNNQRDGWNKYYYISSVRIKEFLICLLNKWQEGVEKTAPCGEEKHD